MFVCGGWLDTEKISFQQAFSVFSCMCEGHSVMSMMRRDKKLTLVMSTTPAGVGSATAAAVSGGDNGGGNNRSCPFARGPMSPPLPNSPITGCGTPPIIPPMSPYLPIHGPPLYSPISVCTPRCYDIIEEEMIFSMSDITEEDEVNVIQKKIFCSSSLKETKNSVLLMFLHRKMSLCISFCVCA